MATPGRADHVIQVLGALHMTALGDLPFQDQAALATGVPGVPDTVVLEAQTTQAQEVPDIPVPEVQPTTGPVGLPTVVLEGLVTPVPEALVMRDLGAEVDARPCAGNQSERGEIFE